MCIDREKVWSWYYEIYTALLIYLESLDYDKQLKNNSIEVVVGIDKGKKRLELYLRH